MQSCLPRTSREGPVGRARRRLLLLAACLCAGGGCAALTNPLLDGVEVRQIPPELLAHSKAGEHTIPLNVLRQPPPDTYRLATGDVLGIYVEGYLGDRNLPLPLHVGPHVRVREQYNLAPAAGYPVPVQADGNIALPAVGAVPVRGLTVVEAREAVRNAYLKKNLVRPETERVLLTLLYPRQTQVLVFRQETALFVQSPEGPSPGSKRGTGAVVDLPAYENDVLHALALTGGLPGLDVYNEIIIFRGCFQDAAGGALLLSQMQAEATGPGPVPPPCAGSQVIRIPLRLPCGQTPAIRLEDVVLHTGDVVFLEARDTERFYTAGLLPPGMHTLPRDRDLDVIEAVSLVRGPLFNGAFGGSNLSGQLIQPGIGDPSPSLLSVLRQAPDGRQVIINVDLRKAVRDQRERILVRAGDVLFLQETPGEAMSRYLTQTFFNFNLFWRAVRGDGVAGIVNVATPDRISSQTGTVNFLP
jgi:protein involved in polysaccharide export with SLBB domain